MGFIDYAWATSLQKDNTKVKILQDEKLEQPIIINDSYGFTLKFPTVHLNKDGTISFLGYTFPSSNLGKSKIGRLFRASVLHLTTHTMAPFSKDRIIPLQADSLLISYAKRLVNDAYIAAYIETLYPDRLFDIAYSNTLAYQKIKKSEHIFMLSTRLMTALLTKVTVGFVKGTLKEEEKNILDTLEKEYYTTKTTWIDVIAQNKKDINSIFDNKVKLITDILEQFGPFLEVPTLRHTEAIGQCSIYSDIEENEENLSKLFLNSILMLGKNVTNVNDIDGLWHGEQEAEALQAFNSDMYQKQRNEKILSKISPYLKQTKFKGINLPEEDYTQYLRARNFVQGTSRRLLDILRSCFDYLDEDPRQEMGQLDLTAVIQSLAANKPATDVFNLDEYLKASFAWSILLDVSRSMQVKGEFGRALAISVGEAARELMTDPTSWTFFGFSDQLYVLKDSSEAYSKRIRARIGGLRFEGLTYLPDAVTIAGKMLAKRFEEQRVLVVISDGWPYGYPDMPCALKETIDNLVKKNVIVIGIGVETDRMRNFFHFNSAIYTPKDVYKRFGNTYAEASVKALEGEA